MTLEGWHCAILICSIGLQNCCVLLDETVVKDQRNRYLDQWKRGESPETTTQIGPSTFIDKNIKTIQ